MLTVEEQIRLIADAAMDALDLDTAAERRATPRETVLDPMPVAGTSSPVQFTEEVVTMIDVKTTDPTEPRQKRPMRVVVAGILAAAAAVAIVLVATSDVDVVTPTDEPSTTVTVPPTTPPRSLLSQPFEPHTIEFIALAPGTYFVDEVDGTPTARILVTIGDGWSSLSYDGRVIGKGMDTIIGGIGVIHISRPDRVFSDACHWSDGYHPGPVATLDGLVAALSEQGGWVKVTAPSDISVDGYAGKAFQRTAPAVISDCSTMVYNPRRSSGLPTVPLSAFRSWENEEDDRFVHPGTGPDQIGTWSLYEPGEIETLWVLDIDGTVVVINTRLFPGPSAEARADFAAVLDSIRIERG
jgi:hypothetical protein